MKIYFDIFIVLPLVLSFSAYGASSVRFLGGADSSTSVASSKFAGSRAAALRVGNINNVGLKTNGTKTSSDVANHNNGTQRMSIGRYLGGASISASNTTQSQGITDLSDSLQELTTRVDDIQGQAQDMSDAVDLINSALDGKQNTLTAGENITITDDGVISANVTDTTYDIGNTETAGITKLYDAVGENTDGTMTQKAISVALNTKQNTLTAGENITIADGVISANVTDTTYTQGTATNLGLTKLYNEMGDATDGTMTQKALKSELSNKQDKLPDIPTGRGKYKLVWNSNTGQIGWEFEKFSLTCSSGSLDIGFDQCADYTQNPKRKAWLTKCLSCIGGINSKNDEEFGLTEYGTWATMFDYGVINGVALCSSTAKPSTGGDYPVSNPSENGGKHCWCKMTSPSVSGWVYANTYSDLDGCSGFCAQTCAGEGNGYNVSYRQSIYGSVEQ